MDWRSDRRYFVALLLTEISGFSVLILAAAHGFHWL